jgi:S-DNA-T family DNA segregation ATPase FtsK/SpoIIIE
VASAATQRPSADIIPTSLRDLFGYRWAFRCSTEASSDTILGHGWACGSISVAE